ncbi:hypothetical protein [Streptomyces sp. NPDC091268]|uniref:hypothetical protein n=1 Tax=Streptomyces sp. NPDC091268 TaxID=3365979 RepID=UPI0038190733
MITEPYEDQGAGGGDPTALPAAAGLALLALGGWLLTTARPWQKPNHPVTLGLGWTASAALLLCGLLLLSRCVRSVHGPAAAPYAPPAAGGPEAPAHPGDGPRPGPA